MFEIDENGIIAINRLVEGYMEAADFSTREYQRLVEEALSAEDKQKAAELALAAAQIRGIASGFESAAMLLSDTLNLVSFPLVGPENEIVDVPADLESAMELYSEWMMKRDALQDSENIENMSNLDPEWKAPDIFNPEDWK